MAKKRTLRDWAPYEFSESGEFEDQRSFKYLDVHVDKEFDSRDKPWPGKHKNVLNWCLLENGYAVGWNENPSRGWSFPIWRFENEV